MPLEWVDHSGSGLVGTARAAVADVAGRAFFASCKRSHRDGAHRPGNRPGRREASLVRQNRPGPPGPGDLIRRTHVEAALSSASHASAPAHAVARIGLSGYPISRLVTPSPPCWRSALPRDCRARRHRCPSGTSRPRSPGGIVSALGKGDDPFPARVIQEFIPCNAAPSFPSSAARWRRGH
jgi:hypothetical protein